MNIKKVLIAGAIFIVAYHLALYLPMIFEQLYSVPLIEALGIIYFLRMNNSGKKYFLPVSICIIGFYGLWYSLLFFADAFNYFWIPCALIFIFYSLRFLNKKSKIHLDYLKYILVLLFSFYNSCLIYYFLGKEIDSTILEMYLITLNCILLLVGFLVYLSECIREILKVNLSMRQKLKKLVIPFLILVSVISIGFLIFSIVQKIEADKQYIRAEQLKNDALREKRLAEERDKIRLEKIKILEDSIKLLNSKNK